MKYYLLLLVTLSSACAIQTRYNLKKQESAQTQFQNTPAQVSGTLIKNTPRQASRNLIKNTPPPTFKAIQNTTIANMQNEIIKLNTVSEQLVEKINSLENIILELKKKNIQAQNAEKKEKAININKEAKQLVVKKKIEKKKKKKLGNFSLAQKAFQNKKWETAIQSYEKYRKLNPKGRNYALATYNIALSLERLGFKEEAKSFYAEILDPNGRYSKSKLAKKIKQQQQQKISPQKAKKL